MKYLPSLIIAAIAILSITALLAALGMNLKRSLTPPLLPTPAAAPHLPTIGWCPPLLYARTLTRAIYREADAGEAVLACYYELPEAK